MIAVAKEPVSHFKSAALSVRVETDFSDLESLRSAWDETVASLGSPIYLSFDWLATWWEFYGAGKDLRLFLFYREGVLAGVVPLYIDRIGFGPIKVSVARLVGANIPPKAFNPPIPPDLAEPVLKAVLAHLFQQDRCDVLSFGPISDEPNLTPALIAAASAARQLVGEVQTRLEGVQSVFFLPGSLDEFFEAMDKDERKKRKYELRVLRRDPAVREDVLADPDLAGAELEDFARLHAGQWQARGKLGHFGSWPRGLDFHRALAVVMARAGRLRFVRILAGPQVISSQYAFVFGNAYFWELPARLVDQKWQRASLGPAGFFALVDAAIKEGKNRVEGGMAHYEYKQKLNAREFPTQILRFVSRNAVSRLRVRLFLTLRACLLWLYFKLWYARVSPKLPARFRKPLWPFWLRLDF
jgi:CelD/BcsL family acetyltransferase involved in cellulose biosynthesis